MSLNHKLNLILIQILNKSKPSIKQMTNGIYLARVQLKPILSKKSSKILVMGVKSKVFLKAAAFLWRVLFWSRAAVFVVFWVCAHTFQGLLSRE